MKNQDYGYYEDNPKEGNYNNKQGKKGNYKNYKNDMHGGGNKNAMEEKGNNDNSNIEYITSIPNINKNNYDPNNYNTFFDTDTNKFQNSYLRNWTNETQRFSTSPNNDNINIEINNGENGANLDL